LFLINPVSFLYHDWQAKKNASGVPYNTVTLQYNDGADGERLRYLSNLFLLDSSYFNLACCINRHEDDMVRYRGALRAQHLVECGDTRADYDILNGKTVQQQMAPARPSLP